jgi:glyoxylase-like metal-dependent hydrolase (beta-lactamase superfamily II)
MLAWAGQLGPISPIQPRLGQLGNGRLAPIPPQHPAYPELGRIDPLGLGHASSLIRPGVAVALSPGRTVLRVTAPNGSVMTGPGTNTYLLSAGEGAGWAVIDPGPDDAAHVQAVLAAAPGPIRWILVTHTHIDHSPAARALQAATGARLYGQRPGHPEWQDTQFTPDVALVGGERLDFGAQLALEVLHTPGHASNHLCYRHVQERLLFTGDHVMQGSTVVINPPDGDMGAYLASLRALAERVDGAEGFDWIAPGHGFLIPQPARALALLLRHRRRREASVLATLARLGPSRLEELLPQVYHDVPVPRHPVAARSLHAHLLHLQSQQRVSVCGEQWVAAALPDAAGSP